MIQRYNRTQTVKAIYYSLGGVFCCVMAFLFFRYLPTLLAYQFQFPLSKTTAVFIGFAGLAVTWFFAYRLWKKQGGLFSYHESGFYHDLDGESAGALVTDFYAHRVTAPAFLLGQIFMAGPMWLLKAATLINSRIVPSPQLESSLEKTHQELQKVNKWQGLGEYPQWLQEILMLAQMGLIDFSAQKGEPRFKIR